jgi:hypothetical protein
MHRQVLEATDEFGFAAAVRAGPHVFVSGRRALDAGGRLLHEGDLAAQYGVAVDRFVECVEACGGLRTTSWRPDLRRRPPRRRRGARGDRRAAPRGAGLRRQPAHGEPDRRVRLATPGALVEVTGLAVVG